MSSSAFKTAFAALAVSALVGGLRADRTDTVIDGGWSFAFTDKADEAAPAATTAWSRVTLPHNYGWQDAQLGKKYYRGPAWYRRALTIPADTTGKRFFLRFEAASAVTDVFLDGKPLGSHRGAFGAFAFEITNTVKPGSTHTLDVRTNNASQPDLAPLSGDFCVFGGLYRPVHLIATDETCITPLDHAGPGVAILQSKVSADEAVLDIVTRVSYLATKESKTTVTPKNRGLISPDPFASNSAKRTLVFSLKDADGKVVARDEREIYVQPHVSPDYAQRVVVKTPHLWQGRADPYLYTAVVELKNDGVTADRITQPVGLRAYTVDSDKGFFLNGKRLKVYGVCMHQDRRDKGWAVSPEDEAEDIAITTDMGANAIRAAHYQHSENFYALCDKAGILVWAEIPVVDSVGKDPAFGTTTRGQLVDLIRQNRNHPSIFAWCLFNEVRPSSPDPHGVIRDLHLAAHAEDPGRPTIGAASHNWWPEMNRITDWLGFNTYPFWYAGPNPGKGFDRWRAIPRIPAFCISEYGAGAGMSQHQQNMTLKDQPKSGGKWHPEEWQTYTHERTWKAIAERDFVWGSFLWNMFDFVVAGRHEGETDGLNDKGLVTHDRKGRKDTFFFYRANWNPAPTLYIASRRDVKRGDASTVVRIYANAPEVTLKVNGKTIGTAKPDTIRVAEFPGVQLTPGNNRIEVAAVIDGKTVTDTCEWEYVPGYKPVFDRSGSRDNYAEKNAAGLTN